MADPSDKPAYAFKPGPPPEVAAYFNNKSLLPSFSWQDVEPVEHASSFAVAKAMQVDVLEAIQTALKDALNDGIPFDQFRKELEPRLRKMGWWGVKSQIDPVTGDVRPVRLGSPRRLKTIYRANMRSARAAGQWDRIERSKRALPYLVYLLGPSERHRPAHAAKEGLVLPVDDPFWETWYPPNGWNCKCHVRQITRREADERGVSESPELPMRDVFNRRTGEIKSIPSGIDVGWESNAGRTRARQMEQLLAGKLDNADPVIARVATRDMATSWRTRRIYEGSATGSVPVAMLPRDLVEKVGAKSRVVQFSDQAAEKMRSKHPEATVDELSAIDTMLRDGSIYRHGDGNGLAFTELRGDGAWVAVVEVARDGAELSLTSYYRASARDMRRKFTDADLVRRGE
jgi:SPP1 gp7 family putative phage head morphogenesis protein